MTIYEDDVVRGDITITSAGAVATGYGQYISNPDGGTYPLPKRNGKPDGPAEVGPGDGVLWLWACASRIGGHAGGAYDQEAADALMALGVRL